jgi:hypothetical protein
LKLIGIDCVTWSLGALGTTESSTAATNSLGDNCGFPGEMTECLPPLFPTPVPLPGDKCTKCIVRVARNTGARFGVYG